MNSFEYLKYFDGGRIRESKLSKTLTCGKIYTIARVINSSKAGDQLSQELFTGKHFINYSILRNSKLGDKFEFLWEYLLLINSYAPFQKLNR